MRGVVISRLGGAEVLEIAALPRPAPGPGEVLVELHYAGVMFGDIYQREGTYRNGRPLAPEEIPLPIGLEGSGIVTSMGRGVTDFAAGDRVVFCDQLGSYADYNVVPAWRVVKV